MQELPLAVRDAHALLKVAPRVRLRTRTLILPLINAHSRAIHGKLDVPLKPKIGCPNFDYDKYQAIPSYKKI